nr:hypothetical protein [Tanacetum cinerariifolium]GFB45778.1 hypothetical protein [Tanacetum cinerariifolium]
SCEEVYLSNTSKTTTVSNTISIPNDEYSDDTPSVAQKIFNEVKDTLVTLQRDVKHRMNGKVINLSSSTHQEIHKIFKDEIVPIVNQVDARVQNFENHFVKEASKFVRDFKSLAMKADDSLDKIKVLECEIERLLRAVAQTKSIIDSLQEKLHDIIYENATLIAQLFDKVSKQKDTTKGTSVNTKFSKQSILRNQPSSSKSKLYYVTPLPKSKVLPNIDETDALSKLVTSKSEPPTREFTSVKNDKVIAP